MNIKAILIDFDGTTVTRDMIDVVCGIVGKAKKSEKINKEYHAGVRKGLSPLIERINFLKGVSIKEVEKKLLQNDFLMPGAVDFFNYINEKKYISILNSGSLISVLEYYKKKLNISYIIGSTPKIQNNTIVSITEKDYSGLDFKLIEVKKILNKHNITSNEVIAIGDSLADKTIFNFAKKSIAINPKAGIEKFADHVICNDLSKVISIIEKFE